jgi:hypothetical protein
MPFDAKTRSAPEHIRRVAARKIASCKTQIIQGIEQIGFANAVIAANADDPFIKAECGLWVVLKAYK